MPKLFFIFFLILIGLPVHGLTPPSGSNKNSLNEPANSGEFGKVFMLSLGGKIYDNIWEMTGTKKPPFRNPAYPKGKKSAQPRNLAVR